MTQIELDRFQVAEEIPLMLNFDFTEESFFEFCEVNRDLRIERNKNGVIQITPPVGLETGAFNSEICTTLSLWNRNKKPGVTTGSNVGYILPNGAMRAPNASWVSHKRLVKLTREQLEKFAPVCPDFVIEICSPSDNLDKIKAKMLEYIANGCRMAWLIDRKSQQVFIYRENGTISLVDSFDQKLSGESVLPGFELVLSELGT